MMTSNSWEKRLAAETEEYEQNKKKYYRRARNGCLFGPFIVFLSILVIITVFSAFFGIFSYLFGFQLNQGEDMLGEYDSPDKTYRVSIYLQPKEHEGYLDTVLGVLTNNETGKSKNLYYCQASDAEIYWKDNTTVVIDGIELNVLKDTFDYKKLNN